MRKAKYEAPNFCYNSNLKILSTQFAKIFKPPNSKEILCFKRQYYIGEGNHLQNKAIKTIRVNKLEPPSEERKFLLIGGPRYDGIKFQIVDKINKILKVKLTNMRDPFMQ